MSDQQNNLWAGGTSNAIATQQNITFQLPTNLEYTYAIQYGVGTNTSANGKKRIGPKLYFSYVKSKLNKAQIKKLKPRLQKLQALIKSAEENGQTALYEELSKMLLIAVRESEAVACGYDVFLTQTDIDKHRFLVRENDDTAQSPVFFKSLDQFPRAIPANIAKIIKSVHTKGLFDELWVLYLDYSGETIKSNKEKIREKDPILFGKFNSDPTKFYFIADWIDEHCDLTLSKFIETMKENDPEFQASEVPDVTPEYLDRLKNEIKEREERLKTTAPGNFRDKMKEEDNVKILREKEEERRELATKLDDVKDELECAERRNIEQQEELNKLYDALLKREKPWYKRIFGL